MTQLNSTNFYIHHFINDTIKFLRNSYVKTFVTENVFV